MSPKRTGRFARPHRRGLIYRFLSFATLGEVVFKEVNLEQLQVEFGVEEKTPELNGTPKNFRRNYDSEPSSGS